MEELTQQKAEFGDKLQREIENLAVLNEALQRSETMTHSMLGILNSFESRLSKLEETIIPIYQETGNLQRRHENIEKTLSCLDQVRGYYNVGEEVEPVVRDGPSCGLEKYLDCMGKLKLAWKYFEKNSPESEEMAQVTTLYEAGKDALEKEFRGVLTQHSSKPVPPVIILDVLAEAEEEGGGGDAQIPDQLPNKVHKDLSAIASWLQTCGYGTDYMQIYSSIRSNSLVKTLQALRDHLKSGSRDSASLNMSSPAVAGGKMKPVKDTPSKKAAVKRMAFVKKASSSLMKHMAQLEAAGLVKHGADGGKDEALADVVDIDYYITSVSALLKLIQCETTMMAGVIPDKHQRKVFDMLIQAGMESIVKEGEQISGNIKRATVRHDHSAVISVFPVLKHLRTIKPEFDLTLEGCSTSTRTKLASLISMLDTTGAKALEQFVDSIRNNPDKASAMPPDGTVHELTSNTLIFLEQLLAFEDTAGSMLLTQDPSSLPTLAHLDRPKLKLAEFVTKVLSALGLSLSNKSETYSHVTMRSIFMLNNYNYILKALRRTGLMERVHQLNAEIEKYYEEMVQKQKGGYREKSWSRVLFFLMDKEHRLPADLHKLKDKDRQAIKDRFAGFNKEMEDLVRIQKGYAIPDQDLRDTLKRDNKEFILPKYKAFLNKYRNTNFSKNPEKYIRYTERDIAEHIDRFFDSAA